MTTSVKNWDRFEAVRDDGSSVAHGGPTLYDPPERLSLSNDENYEARVTVSDDYGKQVLWQDGDGGMDSFGYLWLLSNEDVLVELVLDRNGTADSLVLTAVANIPLKLASNEGAASSTTDSSQTTTKTIDEVSVQRNVADDQNDAHVRLVLLR